jgi:hypothetical protein
MAFNPDEPRDERGRWTGSGAPALAAGGWRDKPLFDRSPAGRGAALAMHASLSMRETFRRRPRWADPASAESLARLLPLWNAAAHLDGDAFRDRYLGHGVSESATRGIRAAARLAMQAQTSGEMARAGDHLANAIRAVGVDDWPRILRVAEIKAGEAVDRQSVESDQDILPGRDEELRPYRLIPSVFAGPDTVQFGIGYHSIVGGSATIPGQPDLGDGAMTSTYKIFPGLGVVTYFSEDGALKEAFGIFDNETDSHGNYILRQATKDEAIGIAAQHQIAAESAQEQLMIAGALYHVGAMADGLIWLSESRIFTNLRRQQIPPPKTPSSAEAETEAAEVALPNKVPRILGPYGRFTSADEFAKEVVVRYQQYMDQGYALARAAADQGRLFIPKGLREDIVIGRRTDNFARCRLRAFVEGEGIAEGPGKAIEINRRLTDPSSGGKLYRVPDVRIPGANLIIDGTIGVKGRATPQVSDFYKFSGHNVTIVRPTQLGFPYTYSVTLPK